MKTHGLCRVLLLSAARLLNVQPPSLALDRITQHVLNLRTLRLTQLLPLHFPTPHARAVEINETELRPAPPDVGPAHVPVHDAEGVEGGVECSNLVSAVSKE